MRVYRVFYFLSVFGKCFFCLCLYLFSPVLFVSIFCKCCFADFFKFSSSSPTDYKLFLSSHIEKGRKTSRWAKVFSFYFRVFIEASFYLFRIITLFRLTVMMPQSPKNVHLREMTGSPTLMIRRKSSFSSYRAQLERCCHLSNFYFSLIFIAFL